MHLGTDGERKRLARSDRPSGKIGREAQSLPIMPGPHRGRQLRGLGRDRLEFERTLPPQYYANQPRAQKQPQSICQGRDHGADL